jgi:hypothetical protein
MARALSDALGTDGTGGAPSYPVDTFGTRHKPI